MKYPSTFSRDISIMREGHWRLDEVILVSEESWIVHKMLLENRRAIHNQIEIMINVRKSLGRYNPDATMVTAIENMF
jgi:hypothetical protein